MRNLKKFLALVLAFVMAMSLMVTVNASSFSDRDTINTKYAEAVDVLQELGVVKGDAGSNAFRPTEKITRAEVAAIIYRLVTGDVKNSQIELYENSGYFSDVADGKWYNGYVNYCANNGLVVGVGSNRFAPSDNISGYEALVMILRAIGYTNSDTFTGSDWKFKASGYARELGITQNISEASLGGYATREMVAEIMFQGLQAPMVRGNILGYNEIVLVADTDTNRAHYDRYLQSGGSLPIYETLMRKTFNVVGKYSGLGRDAYGRPSVVWFYDNASDKTIGNMTPGANPGDPATNDGDASKYIVNAEAYDGTHMINATVEEYFTLALDYVEVYDNVVTECQLSKDVNGDKSFTADMWLNGQQIMVDDTTSGDAGNNQTANDGIPNKDASGNTIPLLKKIDALHTVNDFVNAQGRTMEVYKLGTDRFSLVFIDTFLGRVVETRAQTVDTAGHEMTPAEADIAVGYEDGGSKAMSALAIVTVSNSDGKYSVGDMVLVQTPLATEKVNDPDSDGSDKIVNTLFEMKEFPVVTDVPETVEEFTKTSTKNVNVLDKVQVVPAFTVLGTKIATKGSNTGGNENIKTGIEGANGKTYWLSNTYLAASDSAGADPDTAVLNAYHTEVTNNLINRTFDLYLDQNGYIVGMQETTSSNIGVITGMDYNRAGASKYTVSLAVTDVTGKEVELELLNHEDKDFFKDQVTAAAYFNDDGLDKDTIWQDQGDGTVGHPLADLTMTEGMLIEWTNVNKNGTNYQVISKVGTDFAAAATDKVDDAKITATIDSVADTDISTVLTGVTDTLSATDLIDDDTKFLIANYKVDYSAKPDDNEGKMMLEGYKPYTGFKTIPTINAIEALEDTGDAWGDNAAYNNNKMSDVLYTKLTSNGQDYFAIGAENAKQGYTMVSQKKFTVDESYLMLNSGTTYQFYSTYQALLNGEKVDVNVSNLNSLNTELHKFMAGSENVELITFTGKDAAGNVNAVAASTDKGHFNTRPADSEHGTKGTTIKSTGSLPSYKAGVLTFENTGNVKTYLTMADNAKVVIVNAANSNVTPGTVASINQYAKQTDGTNYFCYELDANGYVSVLYIVD